MRSELKETPRQYPTGTRKDILIKDFGRLFLGDDEQVTFVTPAGKEHDFCAKSWGFYSTPSINGRLKAQGFKTALVRNGAAKLFIMVVDPDRMDEFDAYLVREGHLVEEWLDEREL